MTTVKHFHSAMVGAPVITGAAGVLIAVLDACLVTGFGLKTLDSLVVAGEVATMNCGTGHSFEPDTIALVAGATPAGLNGEKRIISTTLNTATFAAPGVTDQTATGTITARLAPAGWTKSFSGTNLAAYRAVDPSGTRMFLRVDDTSTTNARVVGYESMTDVSTGVGPFPSATQISGGGWWPKASAAAGAARAWTLVADGKGFIVHVHTAATNQGAGGVVWEFGDFASLKSGDAYACRLQCHSADIAGTATGSITSSSSYCTSNGANTGAYLARSFTALGGAVAGGHGVSGLFSTGSVSGGTASTSTPIYPNGPNNGLILVGKTVNEIGICLRGHSRGLFVSPQSCHAAFSWRDKIDGQGLMVGRKLLAIKCNNPAGTASEGVVFIDITGPWA